MKIFNVGLSNKKASLNLSMNAIVIVVLAMTLMGLGLGFIRNMFSDITDTTVTVQQQVRQQILDDLRTGNKKLSFPTDRYTVGLNEKKDIAIGVKNTGDQELTFTVDVEIWDVVNSVFNGISPTQGSAGTFFWDSSSQTLKVGESRVFGILHQSESATGTYLYKIKILEGAVEYDSKSFFVTVV